MAVLRGIIGIGDHVDQTVGIVFLTHNMVQGLLNFFIHFEDSEYRKFKHAPSIFEYPDVYPFNAPLQTPHS